MGFVADTAQDECVDSSAATTIISALQTIRVYWQVKISQEVRDKTAFTSPRSFPHYTSAFSVKICPRDVPASDGGINFKKQMEVCSCLFRWHHSVFANARRTYRTCFRQVMTLLNEAAVALSLIECELFTKSMNQIGHSIRRKHLKVSTRTINAVNGLQKPPQMWWNSSLSWVGVSSCANLCQTLLVLPPHETRSSVKIRRGPLTD